MLRYCFYALRALQTNRALMISRQIRACILIIQKDEPKTRTCKLNAATDAGSALRCDRNPRRYSIESQMNQIVNILNQTKEIIPMTETETERYLLARSYYSLWAQFGVTPCGISVQVSFTKWGRRDSKLIPGKCIFIFLQSACACEKWKCLNNR